ncbi:NERD domain-containing protein [Salinicola endophyticus]|uniref:NERD domain-containing protein n=1 Tax=Salinicola endophyticus TaxID=1949083 RepID=A0ABY8FFP8_9GAMM|nr:MULTISPECIES: nuclease-related domain-containing protein [Salinicola]WFF41644.1 NERD domain-containing protein [Salinicola endophyticus]
MAWLEYLLPLIFLAPLGAAALVAITLRDLQNVGLRSPHDGKPIREIAQLHRDRLERARVAFFLDAALAPTLTLMPLVYGMGRMLFADEQSWLEWSLYGVFSTLLAMLFGFLILRDVQRVRRLTRSLASELAIGQALDHLIRPVAKPFFVFHDFPADSYSIDNVLVTPQGVFVIQTMARDFPLDLEGHPNQVVAVESERLRFPDGSQRSMLRKVRMATVWLRQWLTRHTQLNVPVKGVLVLPGWTIDDETQHLGGDREVQVIDGADLAAQLGIDGDEKIDDEQRQRLVESLDRRQQQCQRKAAAR